MNEIPNEFTLQVRGVPYLVYREPSSRAVGPSSDQPALWAYRKEGSTGASDSVPVIPGESCAELKARIAHLVR